MSVRVIAVGYDHSRDAARAARFAFDLGAATGASVVVVHAVGLREHYAGAAPGADLPAELADLADEAGLDLARLSWRVEDGDACSVLLRAAHEPLGADLVVVGSRGRGEHAGLLLGSTSLELAERCAVPLVIVPAPRDAD
ncbi:MAG: universal stress protein [Acidobacteriota bacterium]|nr:universal stress protein [Acidobacteriota bacterium]